MEKATNIIEFPNLEPWEKEFNRCKPWIEKALKYQDNYLIDDIKENIREGLFHLWPADKSFVITEFVIFPQNKAMNILFCGGDFKELEKMLPYLEKFAKTAGCKRMYGGGRKGWLRKLKHLGFLPEYLIRKEL